MTGDASVVLRKSLDEIDGYRKRMLITFGLTAALSQAAWIALIIGVNRADVKTTIVLAAFAVAMTVFGGVFMLALLIFRVTHRLLKAIEVGVQR
jgi:hypothetical protein